MSKNNELLTLTDEQIKKISKLLDENFEAEKVIKNNLIGKIVEAVDGPFSKMTISQVNKWVSPYISDSYKDEIQAAVDDCLDGDGDFSVAIENLKSITTNIIDSLDVKKSLKYMFYCFESMVMSALEFLLEKSEEEEE